ncbi:AI-2E family transporter [Sulfurimonas sp. ST-27]|uniref:AI-2E family transporter n=1 Tax=unclassified Sulfurimonas TaxID=2623549 RepID=UPI003AB6EEAD
MKEHKIGYYFIVMASVVIVLAGIKSASVIIIPFLLSLFIAIILSPLYNYFKSKSIPDIVSVTLVITVFILFLALIAKLVGNSVHDFSANIDTYAQKLAQYYQLISHYTASFGIEISTEDIANLINMKQAMKFATSIIQSMGAMFTNGFIIILTVIFMLLESQYFVKKVELADGHQETMAHIERIFSKIKNYMVLKALISLFTGAIIWMSLYFLGTDYAFLWGVLAFMLNFIPNIGSIIAAIPAVLITLVQLGGMSALAVMVLYTVINIVIGSILEPKIMGKGLGLSTLIVFLSLMFWGWLLGIVGMLLSIPLTIMAKIIFDANQNTQWIGVLLGTGDNIALNEETNK